MTPKLGPAELSKHVDSLRKRDLYEGLASICIAHHVQLPIVLGNVKSSRVMQARVACYLYLRNLEMSYPEIGKVMLRDHTTVLIACRKARVRVATEATNGRGGTGTAP